ncbi:MAG TPA: SBBP repeat-containing protein [Ignavibacteria bacterium]|nr:hypothetical protein [Bacteroidota bacterium]HRE09765.1 SBBP repeat-containing protein [Ignavibacteria bacterium]HRF65510.1 SBBP repeat-containing protein [Ignavibacteria bacterium]HRJ02995.1 SBBP repeat-containing protein [Ignavibacteria bacterium]HRJ84900.1 SBBP repeat-containing protein [Ignavibacteria bacterium]
MKKLFIFLMFTIVFLGNSQVSQQWVARYNPSTGGAESVRDMAIDQSGNVYVTGSSNVPVTFIDILTVKYNSTGTELWSARHTGIGGGNNDYGVNVAVDGSGNVFVLGTSFGGPSLGLDMLVLKYSAAGTLLWEYRFTGPDGLDDEAYKLILDASSNVYVCGTSMGSVTQKDFAVFKLNSSGATQWSKRYSHTNSEEYPVDIKITQSGDVYVTGYAFVSGNASDFLTVKYNSSGTQQWVFPFNIGGEETGLSLALDASGNAYIGGYTNAYGTGNDCFVYSVSSAGSFRWMQRYTGPGNADDKVNCIYIDQSGNIFAAGNTTQGASGNDVFAACYNSNGTQLWLNTLNVGGNEIIYSVAGDLSSNIYLAGKTNAYGNSDDYLTISYNSSGSFRWMTSYNYSGTQNDAAIKVLPDNSGNVYVTGTSFDDYATIMYTPLTGLGQPGSLIPDEYNLSQNYPNPFNPETNICFSLPVSGIVRLAVYDISGKEISVPVNDYLTAGVYNYRFNASGLSSGVYFYRFSTGNYTETKKMMLLK